MNPTSPSSASPSRASAPTRSGDPAESLRAAEPGAVRAGRPPLRERFSRIPDGAAATSQGHGDSSAKSSRRSRGFAAVLIVLYGILALSATGRAAYELATKFSEAPLPHALSLLAALTYLAVTVLLVRRARRRTLLALILGELAGILIVGSLTLLAPQLFPVSTVWSGFGAGYGFVPLILPIVALVYLRREQRD